MKQPGKKNRLILLVFLILSLTAMPAMAFLPLVSDDTGTQGKGKWLIELSGEMSDTKSTETQTTAPAGVGLETTVRDRGMQLKAALTYGVIDSLDLTAGLPYQWIRQDDGDISDRARGVSDFFFEPKWRFYEEEGFSLALKPGLTLPTGDESRNLGAGRPNFYILLLATREIKPFAIHGNLGYRRNENKLDEREDIWHASAAAEYHIIKKLRLVADIGIETNPDRSSTTPPAYILGGIIYTIGKDVDLDVGVKYGLTRTETDWTWTVGLSIRL